mgnify:CR=1 FL=1
MWICGWLKRKRPQVLPCGLFGRNALLLHCGTNALQCCYAMWRSEAITDANTELDAPMMTGTMMLVTIHLQAF